MISDLISRQDALAMRFTHGINEDGVLYVPFGEMKKNLENLPSAQIDNQVHLCDSCTKSYPECDGGKNDIIFGNGRGDDNVCACSKYLPSAQPERKKGKWERHNTYHGDDTSGSIDPDWRCSECGERANINPWCMYDLTEFCPNCGADMKGAKDESD